MRSDQNPISPTGGVVGLKGNLAPEGGIVKIAGLKKLQFTGRARCFDNEESAYKAVINRKYKDGDIIIIRYVTFPMIHCICNNIVILTHYL